MSLEPIAIVGMACRFPAGADSLAGYWQLLSEAGITVSEVPADRWDWRRYYSNNSEAPGRAYVKQANFLRQDIRAFDASFFGISPREAEIMDPQQRLLLEVAWETIEHAGADLSDLVSQNTGVYIGAFTLDNLIGRMGGASRYATGSHTAVGSTATILSNRISHAFNLSGPSMSIDTACSSSLVAVHLACQAIWQGECDSALAGGVNVMTRPEYVIAMSKGHFLAPDGRSKSFDAAGNGYGRGEGAGMVLLKPLSAALANGDQVLATIKATGCNQDGRTEGITVPNGEAQRRLMREVLQRANLQTRDICYVEAHGTGTALGDPIETAAIGAVFGADRDNALAVGSVKANIGHLEAASGVASLIKLVLSLKTRQLPAVAGLETLNPAIDFAGLNIRIPLALENLPSGTVRMALNSFGYGGTNAHVILESAPEQARLNPTETNLEWGVLPVSARSNEALLPLLREWRHCLADESLPLQGLLAGAALRRSHHECRLAFSAPDRTQLLAQLDHFLSEPTQAERPLKDQRPVFVYSGMGPQWWGMARDLLSSDPRSQAFAQQFDAIFRDLAGWSLLDEMLQPESKSRIGQTRIAQPANFLCQALITGWLAARGIQPEVVIGHSVGEVAAAWASGALTLAQAIKVSFLRAKLQAELAGQGGMLAVGLSEDDALMMIQPYQGRIEIAAINGPTAVTLAGDEAALDELAGRLEVRSIFNRRLRVEVAYHSRYMEPILPALRQELAVITPQTTHTQVWSTVTGQAAPCFDAEYWCRNVREPVRFRAGIEDLLAQGYQLFVEIGPHSVLAGSLREIMVRQGREGRTIATLARNTNDFESLYNSVCRLYAAGVQPTWSSINGKADATLPLPNHPWLREVLWAEAASCAKERLGPATAPLCGERIDHPTPVWERPANIYYLPWVADHQVDGLVLLPGAAYVDTALAVADQMLEGEGALCIEQLELQRPLILDGDASLLYRSSYQAAQQRISISSRDEAGGVWTQHATAQLSRVHFGDLVPPSFTPGKPLNVAALYQRFAEMGLNYGSSCQRIQQISIGPDCVFAQLQDLTDTPADIQHYLHPTVLDGAFQALLALVTEASDTPWVPVSIGAITVRGPIQGDLNCIGQLKTGSDQEIVGELWLCDAAGQLLVHVEEVRCVPAKRQQDLLQGLLYRETFKSLLPVAEKTRLGQWLLVSEDGCQPASTGAMLQQALQRAAVSRVTVVTPEQNYVQLFKDYSPLTLDGIVYLAAGEASEPAHQRQRVSQLHALIQPLSDVEVAPRLYLVTQNAQAVSEADTVSGYNQAAIHGYGRVAHNECPALNVTMIDIDATPASISALAAELLADEEYDDLALRNGGRLSRQVEALKPEALRDAALQASEPTPAAVRLDRSGSTPFWRAIEPVKVKNSQQISLAIHSVLEQQSLCGFTAQVLHGNRELATGSWIVGAAKITPASHVVLQLDELIWQEISPHQGGVECLASSWVAIYQALQRILLTGDYAQLLLFGYDTPIGQAVRVLAPLCGVRSVLNAADYAPNARGLAKRLGKVCLSAVVFADRIDHHPQPLPLAPAAQLICLGDACQMDVRPWLNQMPGIGIHHIEPALLFEHTRDALQQNLALLCEELDKGGLLLPSVSYQPATDWVKAGTPANQVVTMFPLPLAAKADANRFCARGSWLISGGFGGFGLSCAEWLASQGAEQLILLGRSGANAEAAQRLAILAAQGIEIKQVSIDIADAAAVNQLISELSQQSMPLTGVLHAAGVLADKRIADLSAHDLQKVLIPKIDGAWNLSNALQQADLKPKHFVMFSSIAATVGNTRQANYAAANVALDALAAWRRAQGLAADCVAWGALGFGMGTSHQALTQHFSAMGMTPLSESLALTALARVLQQRPGSITIAAVDWEQWGRFEPVGGRSPRFIALTGKAEQSGDAALVAELAALASDERIEVTAFMLAEALSAPLKMAAERIDIAKPLSDLGVDSLMAVEVQLAISSLFGVEFSTLELMRGNTINTLASRVLERMGLGHTTATEPVNAISSASLQ